MSKTTAQTVKAVRRSGIGKKLDLTLKEKERIEQRKVEQAKRLQRITERFSS